MNTRPQFRASVLAFTLIELLTVITIIAILMGLLFPAINMVKEQARKAQAKSDVVQIAAAVKQYYTEYGKYPVGDATPPATGDLAFGTGGTGNEKLFEILRNRKADGSGAATTYNPRGIVFFEGKTASDPDNPRGGFATKAGANGVTQGSYVDPWGTPYRVVVDTNYDNIINKSEYGDFADPNNPQTGCAVYSLGKDGKLGSPADGITDRYRGTSGSKVSDDIISWQ